MKEILIALISIFIIIVLLFIICACMLAKTADERGRVRGFEGVGYQCFHCSEWTVGWSGDFSFEDYGIEGEGIVQDCHCANCGAHIIYMIPLEDSEDEEE